MGADEALRVFEDVIAPATRAQDDPMNLAYIPAAPTRAALAFDAVVSSYNIFAGTWESGAGAIFAENQALAWLVELLGGQDGRRMLHLGRHHRQPVGPGRRPAVRPKPTRPASRGQWRLAAPRRHIPRFGRCRPCWTPKW